jgi:protein-S-isoprenylcysteine O-methyltransferase Ste14
VNDVKGDSRTSRALKLASTVALLLALVFIPAGTLRWPEAWILLLLYGAVVAGVVAWWKKNNPDLLKERMTRGKEAKRWDKLIMLVYTIVLMALLALPGFDAVRFRWSAVPLAAKILGFLGYLPAVGLALWAMTANAYLSDVVRIQRERGQTVCSSGPYRFIRHPMYAGVILVFLCFPLSLGSLYSYIPAALIVGLFLLRTALEDRTLKKELPGYEDYARRVRFRLLPGVW